MRGETEQMTVSDLSVFDRIPSQTNMADRRCLLRIQRALREHGDYVYLEIGSYRGGTIQPHYADPACKLIYSIDKRPLSQPDERGGSFVYPENSTNAMRENLRTAFPDADEHRLVTVDADASDVDPALIKEAPPDFCFIDGEHTNAALVSDMRFCLNVIRPDGIICAHDAGVVVEGIRAMKRELADRGIPFVGLKPGGSVYVFVLGNRGENVRQALSEDLQDEDRYFRASTVYRQRLRVEASLTGRPLRLWVYRNFNRLADRLYRGYARCCKIRKRGMSWGLIGDLDDERA